jgi:hypothetical protein
MRGKLDMTTKTQGEIEAAICKGISRFEQDYMGRGPKDIHAFVLDDMLVVRLAGVLLLSCGCWLGDVSHVARSDWQPDCR